MRLFSQKTLFIMLAVGLGTFLLGLLLAAFGGQIFGVQSFAADSFSSSQVGHHALATWLERCGLVVVRARSASISHAGPDFPLLLLEPEPQFDPLGLTAEQDTLRARLEVAGSKQAEVVLALPKWSPVPGGERPDWIARRRLLPALPVERVLSRALARPEESLDAGSSAVEVRSGLVRPGLCEAARADALGLGAVDLQLGKNPQLLRPAEGLDALVVCAQGVLVARVSGLGIVVSDPDLFNNGGLGRGDHARVLWALFAEQLGAQGLVLDETLHGYETDNRLLTHVFSFPLVVVSWHVLLAAALAGWALSMRFGASRKAPPELPPGKRLLIDNTAELLLAAASPGDSLRRYLHVNMLAVARRFALPDGSSQQDLLERLQELNRTRGHAMDLQKLALSSENPAMRAAEAKRLALRIHAWRQDMTRS